MDAQEKAKELITKYNNSYDKANETYTVYQSIEESHRCALIAVDEILEAIDWHEFEYPNEEFEYWHAVKGEINKLYPCKQ
jgi:hypothetical protein